MWSEDGGGAHLVRGVYPKQDIALANKHLKNSEHHFRGIHSKEGGRKGWTVANMLLYADRHYETECRENDSISLHSLLDSKVDQGFKERSRYLAHTFKQAIHRAKRIANIKWRRTSNVEAIRSIAGNSGQDDHMDMLEGNWVAVTPLAGQTGNIPMTLLAIYNNGYVDYPANLEEGVIPRCWNKMSFHALTWELGDILFFRTNHIHKGPPNFTLCDRDVMFAAEASLNNSHTNSAVYKNEPFNHVRTTHIQTQKHIHTHIHTHRTRSNKLEV